MDAKIANCHSLSAAELEDLLQELSDSDTDASVDKLVAGKISTELQLQGAVNMLTALLKMSRAPHLKAAVPRVADSICTAVAAVRDTYYDYTDKYTALLPVASRTAAFMQVLKLGRPSSAAASSEKDLARKLIAAVAAAGDRELLSQQILARLAEQPQLLAWLSSVNSHMHKELAVAPVATWAQHVPPSLTHVGIENFLQSEEREATFSDFYGQAKARRRAAFACGRGGEAYSDKSKKEFVSAGGEVKAVVNGIGNNARVTVTKLRKVVLRPPAEWAQPPPPTRNELLWVKIGYKRAFPDGISPEAAAASNSNAERMPLRQDLANLPGSKASAVQKGTGKHAQSTADDSMAPQHKATRTAAAGIA